MKVYVLEESPNQYESCNSVFGVYPTLKKAQAPAGEVGKWFFDGAGDGINPRCYPEWVAFTEESYWKITELELSMKIKPELRDLLRQAFDTGAEYANDAYRGYPTTDFEEWLSIRGFIVDED